MSMDFEAVTRLLSSFSGSPEWRIVKAQASREDLVDPAELAACLQRDPPQSGWVVGQSGHHLILDGYLPEGRWLEGEWVALSGASYQLRDVAGGWVLVKVVEGEGEDFLAIERRHLPDRGAPGALSWRVYHHIDGLQCVPTFAAFRGFAMGEQG